MTKHVKIALSGSRDIPFDQLVLSQANVRRVKAGVSIDALAADIARRGLLQSLTVRVQRDENGAETGKYEVPAGGRRFRALQALVKQRKMAKSQAVPCIVREDDAISAEEDSLAENVHREPLHPLDQFRAMQQLVEQGTDIETIAATFMVTPAVVKQRLRLASVSPKLHDVYAEDGMTLEQLIAFAVSENHERQEPVWKQLKDSYQNEAYYIRRKLTEETVRASDKRVRFITLDAYVAAGGYVLRDMFEEDGGGWLQDVALLDRLVDEKLRAEGERIGAEGWKWVAVAVDFPYGHRFDMRPIDGEPISRTAEEDAELEALREEADRLEDQWAGADDIPDAVSGRITAIDEAIAMLVTRPLAYDADEQARAGAFVSIDVDGSLHVERGYVRPEDEPADEPQEGEDGIAPGTGDPADADRDGAIVSTVPGVDDEVDEEEQEDMLRPLPDRLVTELTSYRTIALRDALARSPQVAFAAVLHAFVLDTFYNYAASETCLQVSIRSPYLGAHAPGLGDCVAAKAVDARHESWSERLPDSPGDLWDMLAALDADEQAALFAHCASCGVNALWEAATRYNQGSVSERAVTGRIAHSHILARGVGLDMVAAGWSPTVDNYLGRVTEKNHRQLFAFKHYLADRGVSALHVHHLIMFTGLRENQLPARPHNMFGADASFERILNILGQIAGPLRNGTRADIAFGADAVFDALTAPNFPMIQEMLPTPLDRRRMDLIAKNAAHETWLKGLGEQHMLLKGRGGVGKTVVLLQLAYRAFDKNQSRSLVLTFNKALVADLRRTMALMGIPGSLENGGIGIETVHGFIGRLMRQLGIIDGYDDFLDRYGENKATLLHYLTSGTVSTADLDDLKSTHGDDFSWDLIFVDEGQDWPQDEIAILRYLYDPGQITISDGIDQFVRESLADWTGGVGKRSVKVRKLTRCMRMKANIAAVVRDVAAELGIENWDLEPNLEAAGGRILIVEGDLAARPDLLQIWADEAKALGNYPVDLLACVPPAMVDKERDEPCRPVAAYTQAGGDVWDGTSVDVRQTYPSRREQLRFVQYDSCRGLEGWSVFAYRLDELWNYKVSQRLAEGHEIDSLITSLEDDAHQHAARWIMIPLTRAMDTLVINVRAGGSRIKSVLRTVADKRPDCIEWISVGD